QFLGWLAKLLAKPNSGWTVAELRGDLDGKLKADALLGGERATNKEGLDKIWERIQEIDEVTEATGGSEDLENERAELLRGMEKSSAKRRITTNVAKAYKNITTQKRQFLRKLEEHMPQLTAHLRACIVPYADSFTVSYRPPNGTSPWHIENPTA